MTHMTQRPNNLITLWLPIHTTRHDSTLWVQKRRSMFLPNGRDAIVLFMHKDPGDDPQDGPMLEPRRRYMDVDGNWHIQLQRVIVKPAADEWNRLRKERNFYLNGAECHEWVAWWDGVDEAIGQMAEQGWHTWADGDN